jgi:hypothetical protein
VKKIPSTWCFKMPHHSLHHTPGAHGGQTPRGQSGTSGPARLAGRDVTRSSAGLSNPLASDKAAAETKRHQNVPSEQDQGIDPPAEASESDGIEEYESHDMENRDAMGNPSNA